MKKYLILILFIACSLNAQDKTDKQSAIVTYKTEMFSYPIDTTKVGNEEVLNMMKSEITTIKKSLHQLRLKLNFNQNQSNFSGDVPMQRDNGIDFQNTLLFLDANGIYYRDGEKSLRQINFNNKNYTIELPINFNWKIHSEEKNILGYRVIKATTNKELNNGEQTLVEAWFAPDLPFQFGVKEYMGLPGLILLLREKSIEYKATNIKFKNNLKIDKLQKGQKVSQEEFNAVVRKHYGK